MNIANVIRFIQMLETEIKEHCAQRIVYLVEKGRRAFTNGAFLLGTYLILKRDYDAEKVAQELDAENTDLYEPYRDATYSPAMFQLPLIDCWRAIERARTLGWLRNPDGTNANIWGKINLVDYSHYESPLNADLTEVVPGKFVAFKGPFDLGQGITHEDTHGYRKFGPEYYIRIFRRFKVSTVVRLNEPRYSKEVYDSAGFHHIDLEFEDCTTPPPWVVRAFLREADTSPGLLAVHCKAGLGRTGTLIALYMMRTHGFTAREAIAWLRVMRPGSVIGEQQEYLCRVEALVVSNQSALGRGMIFEDLPALLEFQKPCKTCSKSTSLGTASSCQAGGGSCDSNGIEVSFDGARSSPAALAQQVIQGSDRRAAAAAARAASGCGPGSSDARSLRSHLDRRPKQWSALSEPNLSGSGSWRDARDESAQPPSAKLSPHACRPVRGRAEGSGSSRPPLPGIPDAVASPRSLSSRSSSSAPPRAPGPAAGRSKPNTPPEPPGPSTRAPAPLDFASVPGRPARSIPAIAASHPAAGLGRGEEAGRSWVSRTANVAGCVLAPLGTVLRRAWKAPGAEAAEAANALPA